MRQRDFIDSIKPQTFSDPSPIKAKLFFQAKLLIIGVRCAMPKPLLIIASDFNVMKSIYPHTPNHISQEERVKCILFATALLAYGTFGWYSDDIFIPGKRGRGVHFSGTACTLVYAAFILGAANFISVFVDHYDKRNNETQYQRFAKITRIVGIIFLILGTLVSIFE